MTQVRKKTQVLLSQKLLDLSYEQLVDCRDALGSDLVVLNM